MAARLSFAVTLPSKTLSTAQREKKLGGEGVGGRGPLPLAFAETLRAAKGESSRRGAAGWAAERPLLPLKRKVHFFRAEGAYKMRGGCRSRSTLCVV